MLKSEKQAEACNSINKPIRRLCFWDFDGPTQSIDEQYPVAGFQNQKAPAANAASKLM